MPSNCPICGYSLDTHTKVIGSEKVEPKTSDISVCWNCSSVLQFNAAGNLVAPPKEVMESIERDPRFKHFITTVKTAIKNKPQPN